LRNCFSVAPLRQKPCTTLARFARSASADFPVFSGLDAPHAWFWLPSHEHLRCSSSGRALPSLGGAAFDLLRRPRLPALRAAFLALSATSLRASLKSRSQATLRDALNTASQRSGNPPRHFDPRACLR
jgi:hypothetical protein